MLLELGHYAICIFCSIKLKKTFQCFQELCPVGLCPEIRNIGPKMQQHRIFNDILF